MNYENVKHFNNPAEWITNLASKCNITNASKAFQSKGLANFGDITYTFGAFWAILIQQKVSPKIIRGNEVDPRWWKMFLRWFVAAFLSGIFVTIMAWLQETDGFIPTYSLLFSAISCKLACSFAFFLVADLVNVKLGLLKMEPYS